jgi:catechol 2,3-dioxygenase-like lactoylglutathione lyase family enzyme
MKRVPGVGGIFFKSDNPEDLYQWYEKHLGVHRDPYGQGESFEWREFQDSAGYEPGAKGSTAWSVFSRTTKYSGSSKADFMVNYRVDNLDALLEELKQMRVQVDPHREEYDCGGFAWITDPDGNRIELWEPSSL